MPTNSELTHVATRAALDAARAINAAQQTRLAAMEATIGATHDALTRAGAPRAGSPSARVALLTVERDRLRAELAESQSRAALAAIAGLHDPRDPPVMSAAEAAAVARAEAAERSLARLRRVIELALDLP